MSNWTTAEWAILLVIAGIVFNAGGFVWLARNHFKSVTGRLIAVESWLIKIAVKVGVPRDG